MFQNDRDVIYGETAAQRKKIQDIKTFSYLFRRTHKDTPTQTVQLLLRKRAFK